MMCYINNKEFNKKYNQEKNETNSLGEISELTKVKKSILQKVYNNRGVGAWKTNMQS
jgi:hypothetical protein